MVLGSGERDLNVLGNNGGVPSISSINLERGVVRTYVRAFLVWRRCLLTHTQAQALTLIR
jgi:hypothetical protein